MQPERDYQSLLESVADGANIDWAALDASAATSGDRARYRNLRLVARVAELHRTLVLDDEGELPSPMREDPSAADPSTWGHLTIASRMAAGAFGRIYRAHDTQLERDVALKLLRGDITQFRPVERLLSEARTLAQVHHPNVVAIHGADVRDGRAGLWMELVEGETLDAWIRTHGAMGPGEATTIGIDLCRALAAVHHAGLVHGDVKAQNVMRENGGRIVLMDFGAGRTQGAMPQALPERRCIWRRKSSPVSRRRRQAIPTASAFCSSIFSLARTPTPASTSTVSATRTQTASANGFAICGLIFLQNWFKPSSGRSIRIRRGASPVQEKWSVRWGKRCGSLQRDRLKRGPVDGCRCRRSHWRRQPYCVLSSA